VGGAVGIGGLAPGGTVQLGIRLPNANFGLYTLPVSPGASTPLVFANSTGAGVGSITCTDTTTAFNTSSDARLKHAISALAGALERVQALRPVAFAWNADDSQGYGFIAHELQQIIPEAVTGEPDAVGEDGSIRPQGVDHSKLVPWLTAALQETLVQLDALTARVAVLEAQ